MNNLIRYCIIVIKSVFVACLLLPFCVQAQNIVTIAGNGIYGYSGDNTPATTANITNQIGIAIDGHENVFFTDSARIRKISTTGIITTVAGTGVPGFSGDNGPATDAQLSGSGAITVDLSGNLYISEWGNERIRKVNSAGIITTIAGDGTYGYSGENIQATSSKVNGPSGIVTDNAGNIYFANIGDHRVRKINSAGIINTIAGTGTSGFSGDNGPATNAQISTPAYLCISTLGEIYFSDWHNGVVRKINTAGVISTIAGAHTGGSTSDGIPATTAQLLHVLGVAIDSAGNLFIADQDNAVIRKVDNSGIITTIAGTGVQGFSGDNGPAIDAELNYPNGIALDPSGNLCISDWQNNRIRRINYNTSGIKAAERTPAQILIYPNPVTSQLIIEVISPTAFPITEEQIIITDLLGKKMSCPMHRIAAAGNYQADVSHLPQGPYFLKIDGTVVSKFIKE